MKEIVKRRYYLFWKRSFDIVASFLLIIVLFVPSLFLGLWIFIVSPGPVLFIQTRYGKNGRFFPCLKFRTMKKNAPNNVPSWEIDHVWTYFILGGSQIRKLGWDELPQLINILIGQMSFIGPRPCGLGEEQLFLLRKQNGAASCLPGLTGYAQVSNRSLENNEQKAQLDGYYASNASLRLDWFIFWKTFSVLLPKKTRK